MGDLEEFGFNKNAACGNMCMPFNSESWEEYMAKAKLFLSWLISHGGVENTLNAYLNWPRSWPRSWPGSWPRFRPRSQPRSWPGSWARSWPTKNFRYPPSLFTPPSLSGRHPQANPQEPLACES